MKSVWVIETEIAPGRWEPRGGYLKLHEAGRELEECREGVGGRWRVRQYVPKPAKAKAKR
jgi:hypothetical protein